MRCRKCNTVIYPTRPAWLLLWSNSGNGHELSTVKFDLAKVCQFSRHDIVYTPLFAGISEFVGCLYFFFFNIPLLEMLQARICLQHLSSKKWKWNFIISVCEIVHDSHQHAAIEKAWWFTSIYCHRKYVFSQNCYFGLFDNALPHIFRAV